MPKDIEVTLYDIFGYLLPGFVFIAGIGILLWVIFFPTTTLPSPQVISNYWLVIGIAAYVVGHMAQAIGNVLAKYLKPVENLTLSEKPLEPIISTVKSKVGSMLGGKPEAANLDYGTLYRICDEAVVQYGKTNDRDIYIYREGFYRGLTVAFFLLAASLVVRAFVPGTAITFAGAAHPVGAAMLLLLGLLSLAGAWLSFNRYRRFGQYRARQAILGFLVLYEDKILPQNSK